jgi:hypothetical protein
VDERQQVHSVAAMLIEKHGVRAIAVAKHNALKARAGGDLASSLGWQSVALAAEALLSGEAGEDAGVE